MNSPTLLHSDIPAPDLLEVIYQDAELVVINKPSGLLVHRSPIDKHETRFAVQELRNQLGQHVYPLHRLDKPTSGVLVFALSSETPLTIKHSQCLRIQRLQEHKPGSRRGFLILLSYCPGQTLWFYFGLHLLLHMEPLVNYLLY